MNRTARTALAVAVGLLTLATIPSAASAQGRSPAAPVAQLQPRPARLVVATVDAASYRRSVEQGLAQSDHRIMTTLARNPVRQATYAQIVNDLTEARRLIRTRVATVTQDGKVTSAEQYQVRVLVDAIASDLTKTYGSIDSWRLL